MRYKMSVIPARDSSHKLEYTPQGVKLLSSATTGKAAETGSSKTFYHATIEWSQQQNILNMLLGMSCPSWQWHRIGYRWSPVRTLPVAPLWCDLGRCPEQSWLESCGESPPKNKTAVLREQGKSCRDKQQQNILCDLPAVDGAPNLKTRTPTRTHSALPQTRAKHIGMDQTFRSESRVRVGLGVSSESKSMPTPGPRLPKILVKSFSVRLDGGRPGVVVVKAAANHHL